MSVRETEKQLALARERLGRAIKALEPKHIGGEWQEYHAAHAEVLGLERKLGAMKGEEYAEPEDFPVKWDSGAPLPQLLRNDYKCLLAFYVAEPHPDFDGTNPVMIDPASGETASLALVEFAGCVSARLGAPNDEVFQGHPLFGRGGDGYTAQRVLNSRWLAELEAINSAHRRYDPSMWRDLKHYIFWFHDSTFECAADGFKVELFNESMKNLLARASARLLE